MFHSIGPKCVTSFNSKGKVCPQARLTLDSVSQVMPKKEHNFFRAIGFK